MMGSLKLIYKKYTFPMKMLQYTMTFMKVLVKKKLLSFN